MTAKVSRMIGLRSGDKPETPKEQAAPGAIRQIDPNTKAAQQAAPTTTASTGSLMNGTQPIPPSSSFDSRWTAFR